MPWRMNRSPRVTLYLDATTDAEGRFVFESIPPGEWKVQRELNKRPEGKVGISFPAFSHGMPLVVRSGETATVALGDGGRTVVGRAVAPTPLAPDVWAENSVALILRVPAPDAPKFPGLEGSPSSKEFQEAQRAYQEQSLAYWNSDTDRKSTRLNSSHVRISYAVFCL